MKKLIALLVLSSAALFGQAGAAGTLYSFVSTTLQNAATATGNGTSASVGGFSAGMITVNCSVACSGGTTINFEGSQDSSNYSAVLGQQAGTNTIAATVLNQGTTPTVWEVNLAGFQSFRARISGYSAGTITVTMTAVPNPFNPKVVNDNLFLGGTAADGNSGNKSAQTLRTVIATDQPNLTTALNVAAAATLAAETTKVIGTARMIGNVGGVMDTTPTSTAPANALQVGGQFVTTPTTLTTGQAGALQLTAAQNLKTDMSTVAGTATSTAASGVQKVGVVGNAGAAVDAATGAAPPANGVLMAGITSGATGGFLTGIPVCDSTFNINIATATTTLAVTGVSGRHVRICEIDMVTAAANNVGIISGTGATCGTGSAAIVGTTAATGYNFAANGGIATGDGIGMIKRTVATGDSVCIITSATTQLSGTIAYTIY